jgi:hypothetical protein
MTDTYELPELLDIEVELPKLPPMGYGREGYSVLAMQQYAVEYAERFARAAIQKERERAEGYREALAMIAAQGSANPGSTSRVDCMAALAAAAIRAG